MEDGLMVIWHTKNLYSSIFFQNYLIITHILIHKKRLFSYFALSIIVDIKNFIHLNIYVKAISLTNYRSKHVREYYMKNDWPSIVISRFHVLCNIFNHSSRLILPVAKGKCKNRPVAFFHKEILPQAFKILVFNSSNTLCLTEFIDKVWINLPSGKSHYGICNI